MATINFNHRMLAYAVVLLVIFFSVQTIRTGETARVRRSAMLMLGVVTGQLLLGIGTVMTQVAIPVAATHQVGAVLLLTAVLYWIHAQSEQKLVTSD